jgi:hypothetical protein
VPSTTNNEEEKEKEEGVTERLFKEKKDEYVIFKYGPVRGA